MSQNHPEPDVPKTTRRRALAAAATMGALGTAGCSTDDDGGNGSSGNGNGGGNGGGGNGGGANGGIDESVLEGASLEVTGWGTGTEQELTEKTLNRFEGNHDGVEVEYNPIPDEYERNIQTQMGSGDVADVFYVNANVLPAWAEEGVLLGLDEYIEADDDFSTDDFFDPLIEGFQRNGTQYGIPKDFSTLALHYNTEVTSNAGVDEPPESWEGLRSALEAIAAEGDVDYPMIEYDNGRSFWAFMRQKGGQVLSDDGSECVVASDESVEALEFLAGLFEDDLIGRPSEVGVDWHGAAMGSEAVAMAAVGPWALPFYEDNHPDVDERIDVAWLPTPADGEQATPAYTVSWSSSIHAENPEAAYLLISELTGDEGMADWAREGLALSARESHADLEYYQNHPRRQTHLEYGEHSDVQAFGPHGKEVQSAIEDRIGGVVTGELTPREALESAQEHANNEIL